MSRKGEKQLKQGPERQALAIELAKDYYRGASIRDLAETHNRSYTFAYQLLKEAEVKFRPRGFNNPMRKPDTRKLHWDGDHNVELNPGAEIEA